MEYAHSWASPLGAITLTSDGEALTGLWFEGGKHAADGLPDGRAEANLSVFAQAERWLELYFSGIRPDFTPLLHLHAPAFRVAVWEILLTIPYGQTRTYGEIAALIAQQRGIRRMSAQAVGGAVGRNPISIIIPCHRVVGADGSLTGYAGGLERKQRLLALEKHQA